MMNGVHVHIIGWHRRVSPLALRRPKMSNCNTISTYMGTCLMSCKPHIAHNCLHSRKTYSITVYVCWWYNLNYMFVGAWMMNKLRPFWVVPILCGVIVPKSFHSYSWLLGQCVNEYYDCIGTSPLVCCLVVSEFCPGSHVDNWYRYTSVL